MKPRPPLARRRRLLYACLPALMMLAVGEAVARGWLYWLAPAEVYPRYALASEFPVAAKYAPHHYSCYRLQPGYAKGGTHHNELGFRGSPIARPKPPGVCRIVVLGGSTTYGEFIDADDATCPARMEQTLRASGHAHVEVVNAGIPGYNSWESLIDFQFRVLDLEPDVVLICIGVNDVHCRLVPPAAYRGDNSGRRQVWTTPLPVRIAAGSVLARIVAYHAGLWRSPGVEDFVKAPTADPGGRHLDSILKQDPNSVLDQNPPTFSKRNLLTMMAVARAHGVRPVLATWPYSRQCGDYMTTAHYQRGVAELNAVIRAVAERTATPVCDLAKHLPEDRALWRDGRHVNERGAQLQGRLVAEFLRDSGVLASTTTIAVGRAVRAAR